MALMIWCLGKKIPGLYQGGLLKFIMAVLTAAGLMAAVCYLVNGALVGMAQGKAGLMIQIGLSGIAGMVVFMAAVFAMRVEEALMLWQTVRKALAGRGKL
jgi:putative peptidoglycan lipid II flippase